MFAIRMFSLGLSLFWCEHLFRQIDQATPSAFVGSGGRNDARTEGLVSGARKPCAGKRVTLSLC